MKLKHFSERTFDILLAFMMLMLLAIPMAITAIAIFFVLGRPILFKQQRPGLHAKTFTIYKFRTMVNKNDADGQPLPDADRMHRLGALIRKFSLDEFPQLFNVIKGDMRFVGPRPLLIEYLPLYSQEQLRRHEVKPGITGWAQVNGRNAITYQERFKLDVWYVDHHTFWFDIKIMLLTVLRFIKPQGVNQPGCVTYDRFTGNQ